MTAGMAQVAPGLSIGGVPARDHLAGLSEDERLGAVVEDYRDWDFIVFLNLYEIGSRPPRKRKLTANRLLRWLISRDRWGFHHWSWQVNGPNGQCCGSTAHNRIAAIAEAREHIDNYIEHGSF